jgi:predicted kinase
MEDKTIIVMTGVAASGKSTFCTNYFDNDKFVRINGDNLRKEYKSKATKMEDKLIADCISEGKSFIIDNTNVKLEQRKKYIDIAKENGYKVVNFYIPTTKEIAIERNKLREGDAHVSRVVIYTMLKRLVIPTKEEGFDKMYIVDNSGENYVISSNE